ncbi:secretion protein [Vibrio sp. SM6]|uniref:Secretion protein n=1 Tax=Vibrio agarilyticus TaxID=2726741 RepID=A0A7X8YH03_9VIBR|nr:secretion protein [Vibrio agarilyticus]NLS13075.1 secretion protein [Vibrio agarilyticus]
MSLNLHQGWVLVITIMLHGCVSGTMTQTAQATFTAKADLLHETQDYPQLITHYKTYLKQNRDDVTIQMALIDAYLLANDLDSADFHYQRLNKQSQTSAEGYWLGAKIAFAKNQLDVAIELGTQALALRPDFAEVENLLGMAHASKGDMNRAWHYFYAARENLFDDATIKNNLAVIDILLKDYQLAISRLEPLYQAGRRDDTLIANLALAYAKAGHYEPFQALYINRYNASEREALFVALRMAVTNGAPSSVESP